MTTVVIDCKTKQIAADSQTTSYNLTSNGSPITHTTTYVQNIKVHRVDDVVFVAAGNRDAIQEELHHYKQKGYLSGNPQGEFIIALCRRKGSYLHVDIHKSDSTKTWWGKKCYKQTSETLLSDSAYITFGSGGKYAQAGMEMRLSAEQAVILASKCDPYTDDKVTMEQL